MIALALAVGVPQRRAAGTDWWRGPDRRLDGVEPGAAFSAPLGGAMLAGTAVTLADLLAVSSASKRVVGPTGTLDTIAANTPAVDGSTGRRRLLVEAKAATKYGPCSELIGGTGYGLGNLTQGAASLGPDGTAGMREIIENTASGVAHNWWSWTVANSNAAGEHWAHQIVARRGVGARNVKIRSIGGAYAGAYPEVCVNLATGAIVSSANAGRAAVVAMTIPGVGSCWRIEMTATTTQAGTIVHSAYFLSGTGSSTDYYAGDGASSIHFGYANVERVASAGEPPSSYVTIPSTAAVTRIADDVRPSAAVLAQIAAAGGATIVVRGSTTWAGNGRIVGYQGGALSPLIMSNADANAATAYDGATAISASAASGGWNAFGAVEAHGAGAVRLALGGGAVAMSSTFAAAYFAPSTARFFASGDGTNAVDGFLDEVMVWPLVGSEAALRSQARAWA